jgi:hypothetical protein
MRVDDDNSDRVQQEMRAQERKLQQQQQQRRANESTNFDRAMQSRQQDTGKAQGQTQSKQAESRSAIQSLISNQKENASEELQANSEEVEQEQSSALHERTAKSKTGESRLQNQARSLGRTQQERSLGEHELGDLTEHSQQQGTAQNSSLAERGSSAAKDLRAQQQDRKTDQQQQQKLEHQRQEALAGNGVSAQVSGKVGGIKGDKGQGQGQGEQNQGGKDDKPAAFKLPPAALMAPPTIARPKEVHANPRLRQMAQEIAEKIVKHVRVGTNKIGLPEFQIELKSDILKGLKVKVSGRHGRIRALFASKDREVLQQLRGEVASLKEALSARGFKVDALEIEEERG